MWGLMHDASEAYLVDIPSPLKHQPAFAAYREAEAHLMFTICRRFGMNRNEPKAVRNADAVLLATEARDLMTYRPEHWEKLSDKYPPLIERIVPWSHETARSNFLARYAKGTK